MNILEKTICFTGHRTLNNINQVKSDLNEILIKHINLGYCSFLAGGALGFDMLAAETIFSLKRDYPQIYLTLVLPFKKPYEYEKGWKDEEISILKKHLCLADKVVFLNLFYKKGCYYTRDRYLVDNSTLCIAYQTRKTGGTAYTVNYAKQKNLKIINIAEIEKTEKAKK